MKKHKSVVAILLAVMMIFTMMPAMAFAAEGDPVWDKTFSSVTIGDKTYTNITKTWSESTGKVTAAIDWSDYAGESDGVSASVDYWDLDTAAISGKGTWSNANFAAIYQEDGTVTGFGLTVSKPSYVTGTSTATPAFNDADFDVTFYASGFDPDSWDAQEVTISANVVPAGEGTDTASPNYVGAVTATKKIKVEAKVATPDKVEFFVDKAVAANATTGTVSRAYDGASHKIVNSEVPGITVAYEMQNPTTKAYEAVSAIEFKDAGKYFARATATNPTTKAKKVTNFTITVSQLASVGFGFDKGYSSYYDEYGVYYVKEGVEYDTYTFVEPYGAKEAVAANKDDLMAWFKDNYEITEEPYKYDDTYINLTIKAKEGVDAKAMEAKYPALYKNFGSLNNIGQSTALLKIVKKTEYYEIEFTNTPTKKTYKAKVLKKKAKSFKVHAEATTGEAVNYKLINAPEKIVINKTTGKITLKKGLKKGTYKIKVKAYIPMKGSDASSTTGNFETHAITIKVK